MILLWGLQEDGPLAAVCHELRQAQTPFVLVDQRRAPEYTIEVDDWRGAGVLRGPGLSLRLQDVQAAYVRPYCFSELDIFEGIEPGSEAWQRTAQFEESLLAWCDVSDALVVNRPQAMGSNTAKPYQAEMIRQQGFLVPDTLLTTEPESVKAFQEKHGQIIFKSISSWRSVVRRLSPEDLDSLPDIACCPTQFQEFIEGTDYRVHALGEELFITRICSQADDYRYGHDTQIVEAQLCDDIQERCIGLSKSMGLFLSGIDLRQSLSGQWYCFEVNPSPGFTYFDRGERRIGASLARQLASAPRRQGHD